MPSPVVLSDQERRLYSRLRELLREPGLLRGNLVEMNRQCGKKTCRCQQSDSKHRALCLGFRLNGKHRTVYIPAAWEDPVRQWVHCHSEVRDLLEQLSLLFLDRLQNPQLRT